MEEENRRICECCGAKMVEYRHALNKGMTIALKELYDQGGKAHIATMKLNFNQRSNFQKLQYWGLIFQTTSPKGEASAGWWALTNLGKDFVAGGYAVRRHAWSYRGRAMSINLSVRVSSNVLFNPTRAATNACTLGSSWFSNALNPSSDLAKAKVSFPVRKLVLVGTLTPNLSNAKANFGLDISSSFCIPPSCKSRSFWTLRVAR